MTEITILPERLAQLSTIHLDSGHHKNFDAGACAMELASWLTGSQWSDRTGCVCPVIGAFVRPWNDGLPDDERDALLRPVVPRLIGTRGTDALAERRGLMALDWLVRVHTPTWLRLAKLDAHADTLAALPEITSMEQIPLIRVPIDAACIAAHAARSDANAYRVAAAIEFGIEAKWDAVSAAAGRAAWAAAWAAARAAARAAAGAAAGAYFKPTRDALVQSAAQLLDRMIDAKEPI